MQKKPIYKKWWVYVIAGVVLIAIISAIAGRSKLVKINWDEMVLDSQLPEPLANKGENHKNSFDELGVGIKTLATSSIMIMLNPARVRDLRLVQNQTHLYLTLIMSENTN